MEDVGQDDSCDEHSREIFPITQYRAQIFHHAATWGVNKFSFFVGTGGLMTDVRIHYACVIIFAEQFRHKYT